MFSNTFQKLVSKPQLAVFRHKVFELMRNILKRNNYMLRAMEFANKRDHENPLGVFLIMQGRRHRGYGVILDFVKNRGKTLSKNLGLLFVLHPFSDLPTALSFRLG